MAEEVAGAWLVDLFGLPPTASVGYTTGATMASFTGLAAGRHALLAKRRLGRRAPGPVRRAGDPGRRQRRVARHDLRGAPDAGPGSRPRRSASPPTTRAGCAPRRWRRRSPDLDRPALVVAQAGQRQHRRVRPAAADRPSRSARTAAGSTSTAPSGCGPRRDPVAPAPRRRAWGRPTRGRPTPTSGSTCPYDSGLVARARRGGAPRGDDARGGLLRRDRGRASATRTTGCRSPRAGRAGSRSGRRCGRLGRQGVAELIARNSRRSRGGSRPGSRASDGIRILNDVVLNQVLVRFEDPSGDPARATRGPTAIVAAVQRGRRHLARRHDLARRCARCGSRCPTG